MSKQFDTDLASLETQLTTMGRLVGEMMDNVRAGLMEWNSEPFAPNNAIEDRIDRFQREIDEQTIHMIAVYTPVAADLRHLLMFTRINTELERIGDQAANIGFYSRKMFSEPVLRPLTFIPKLIDISKAMVIAAMDAFRKESKEQALAVIKRDDEVDKLYDELFKDMMGYIRRDPQSLTQAMELILTGHSFERIADHAVNIAEDVYYIVEGLDIRHIKLHDIEARNQRGS